ncbi:MAG: hypothetical protein EBZ77_07125, partial [Chitinophagia bacterium]|nr:hypothetical protein [Chitinophagia bacterium]
CLPEALTGSAGISAFFSFAGAAAVAEAPPAFTIFGSAFITYTVTNACGSATDTAIINVVVPAFTAGNLVVLQVNDTLSTGASLSLVEYATTSSTPVNSLNLPSSGTGRIVLSGSASSEGSLTLDAQRNHLIFAGYDTSAGYTGVATAANINRKIYSVSTGIIPTEVRNLSQTLVFNTNNFRGATANGTDYYGIGTVQLMAASTATKITNSATVISNGRVVQIFNGQMYASTGSGTQGVYTVGTGIPTAAVASTIAHATGTGIGTSPYGFSISPDSNTLYVADDGAGIEKFTRTGGSGSFSFAYVVNARKSRSVAVDYSTRPYTIYATTVETGNAPDSIIKITDNGASSAYTTIAGSQRGKLFRGISFAPANYAKVQATATTICAGTADTITFFGNPGATLKYRVEGSATSFTFDASGRKVLIQAFANSGPGAITKTYQLDTIITTDGRFAMTGNVVITVNPVFTANTITGTRLLCAGTNTTLADTATGGTWSSSASTVATVSSTGVLYGLVAGNAIISYTRTGTCGSQSDTANITVIATPATPSAITGTTTTCVGATTTLSDATAGGNWSSADTTIAVVSSTGVVTGRSAGSVNISYSFTNTCGTSYALANVTVFPAAVIGSITGTTTACAGTTAALSDTSAGGTWSTTAASVASVDASGTVYAISGGTATISYSVTGVCGTSVATTLFTVNTAPVLSPITGTPSACSGTTSALSNSFVGGAWSTANAAIASVDASGLVYAVAAGSTTISYIATNSCGADTETVAFNVTLTPTVGAITGASFVCAAATTTLSNSVAGGTWSTSDAATVSIDATSGVATGVASGSVIITYTLATSCGTATDTAILASYTTPLVAPIVGTATHCLSATNLLTDSTAGGVWTSGTPSVASVSSTGVVTGITTGVATISYTVSNSCFSTTVTFSDTIISTPTVAPITGVTPIMIGQIINASSTTSGGTWNISPSGIANISSTGQITGSSAGTAIVSYTVSYTCGSAFDTALVTVSQTFGAGNLVVYQVNDTVNTGVGISVVEYSTTGGSAVRTVTLRNTGTTPFTRLVASGTATSEGMFSLDAERSRLVLSGYDTTTGLSASVSSATVAARRAVFTMLPSGVATNVAGLTNASLYTSNNFRSATASGTNYFTAGTGGTGGVFKVSGTTATSIST